MVFGKRLIGINPFSLFFVPHPQPFSHVERVRVREKFRSEV